jgi:monothiol glutaredoxin
MRELRLGGLVESVRGAEGGYRLARPAEAISVWSALEVLGGAFFSEQFCECHGGQQRKCVRSSDCGLRALWRAVQEALRETRSRASTSPTSARRERDGGLARPDPARAALLPNQQLVLSEEIPMNDSTRARIDGLVKDHRVLLFMKGNRQRPQCGFSAQVVQILDSLAARLPHGDVLEDPEIRDGIKEYSSWPTIPQLYLAGSSRAAATS